jgi:hypothetical protein
MESGRSAVMKVPWPEAYIDLDDVRERITEDNPDAADQVITEALDGLASAEVPDVQ